MYALTDLYIEEWPEEEVLRLTEDCGLGRTPYKIATEAIISKKVRLDPKVPLFERELSNEYRFCYWNKVVRDIKSGYATISKFRVKVRRFKGFLLFFFQKSAIMALCPSLKDIIINITLFKDPVTCLPSVKFGGAYRNGNYLHALERGDEGELLNRLVIANRTKLDSPELLMPYHEVLHVSDLSLNKFGSKKKGVPSSIGFQSEKYYYWLKDTTLTDLAFLVEDGRIKMKIKEVNGGLDFPADVVGKGKRTLCFYPVRMRMYLLCPHLEDNLL
jgi:hypothetical protein